VTFLGSKAHNELVRYSQHWTASILPFKQNAQIESCNPLKLYEYLAAGQPIVSTYFPALEPYKALIEIANNEHDMINALNVTNALSKEPQHERFQHYLRQSVANQTWLNKAQQVSSWLDEL
jgi:hypothetical protein